jgi:hypothetical protein
MLRSRAKGQRPQIVFTSDFHELARGDLQPGSCVLRYDPHRVVPPEEISSLPATQRPITAHVRFHPTGAIWEEAMLFRPASRLIADNDPTGQGTMLEIECPLREGTDELECWFSYVDNRGQTRWDSNNCTNFWVRFPAHDLTVRAAEMIARPTQAFDWFKLEVESVPAVETVVVRWRYTNAINDARHKCSLVASPLGEGKLWMLPDDGANVASNTPVAFDLVYTVTGHEYTDDNEGTWYIVSRA